MASVHVSTRNVVPDIPKTQKRVAVTSGIWISLFWKLSELEKACSVSSRKGGAIPQNLKRLFMSLEAQHLLFRPPPFLFRHLFGPRVRVAAVQRRCHRTAAGWGRL